MNENQFNKKAFGKMVRRRYGIPRKLGEQMYDDIGLEMEQQLQTTGVVRAFGIGTLVVVARRGRRAHERVVRFRPAKGRVEFLQSQVDSHTPSSAQSSGVENEED